MASSPSSDQHSTNGTWVGNARVFEAEVPLFTTVRVGETELTLEPQGGDLRGHVYQGIIGNDPAVRQLAELIERVAPSPAAVAIFGESGTGKELVARALHQRSSRAEGPFIPVNCAAISKELIESELFGHEKGAFTGATNARKGAFEEADGGTLFLDEIGELPLDLQAKLLRALESGEIKRVGASKPQHVDVRIVAATNRDLLAAARGGAFREDLYYRLCVIPLHLPPLRNRLADLPLLAEHFVRAFAPKGQAVRLSPAASAKLQDHALAGQHPRAAQRDSPRPALAQGARTSTRPTSPSTLAAGAPSPPARCRSSRPASRLSRCSTRSSGRSWRTTSSASTTTGAGGQGARGRPLHPLQAAERLGPHRRVSRE